MSKKPKVDKECENGLAVLGFLTIIIAVCWLFYKGYKTYNLPSTDECWASNNGSVYKTIKYNVDIFSDEVHYKAESVDSGISYDLSDEVEHFMKFYHKVDKSLCGSAAIYNEDYKRIKNRLESLQNQIDVLENKRSR